MNPNPTSNGHIGTPDNYNSLSPVGFKFQLMKFPDTQYTIQKANIPGLSFTPAIQSNPMSPINVSGDTPSPEDLVIQFIVDEDLNNWREMYAWIRSLCFPAAFTEFANLKDTNTNKQIYTSDNFYSTGSLMVLTNQKNPNIEIVYNKIMPYSITGLDFDLTLQNIPVVTSTVSFKYLDINIKTIRT